MTCAKGMEGSGAGYWVQCGSLTSDITCANGYLELVWVTVAPLACVKGQRSWSRMLN